MIPFPCICHVISIIHNIFLLTSWSMPMLSLYFVIYFIFRCPYLPWLKICNFLLQECIRSALKNKTVILVTHQVEFLREADMIIVRIPIPFFNKNIYVRL